MTKPGTDKSITPQQLAKAFENFLTALPFHFDWRAVVDQLDEQDQDAIQAVLDGSRRVQGDEP